MQGPDSFTSQGSRYYHVFNISLCNHPEQKAMCESNISARTGAEVSWDRVCTSHHVTAPLFSPSVHHRYFSLFSQETFNLTASVCRMTMIPGHKLLATQPVRCVGAFSLSAWVRCSVVIGFIVMGSVLRRLWAAESFLACDWGAWRSYWREENSQSWHAATFNLLVSPRFCFVLLLFCFVLFVFFGINH